MYKHLTLIILLFFSSTLGLSQQSKTKEKKEKKEKVDAYSGATWKNNKKQEIKGSISGKIIDKKTKKPIGYTNISITNSSNKKTIEGTISKENGRFIFNEITIGEYILDISFLGYKTKTVTFKTTESAPDYRFKKIELETISKELNEIEINENKAVYENKIDKIVYNPENDVNQNADDATDVLRKAPLLSVDLDGNVSLRGSQNIKFLVNGKASTFLKNDVASALQMIPADQIKSVEVITSPGAKYDGEGDAGIVNIITKKKVIDGYKGTVSGSIGNRVSRNNLNLTIGKNNFGLSARGGMFGMYWPRTGKTDYKREDWDTIINGERINENILTRNGETFSRWTGYRSGIDMYYDINSFNSLTSSFSFGGRDKFSDDTTDINYTGDTSYSYQSIINSASTSNQIEWTTDFTKKFANNPDRELSVAFQINSEFDNENTDVYENNNVTKNSSDGIGTEKTFQLDYTHPLSKENDKKEDSEDKDRFSSKSKRNSQYRGKNGSKMTSISGENKLEIGMKYIERNNKFDYITSFDTLPNIEDEGLIYLTPQETFKYRQSVTSAYLSSQLSLPSNIGLVIGGRCELTNIDGEWKNNAEDNFDREPYWNFLPNLAINKKISMTKSLKLSYNKRIRRPSSYYINPNVGITDNKNIIYGNPELEPAKTDQFEFGYNSFGRMIQSSYYIYYKSTKDVIESNIQIQGDTSITRYTNIGNNSKIGFNYYGSIMLKGVNLRGGFNVFEYSSNDSRYGEISAILYNYNFGGTIDLGNKFKFETWGWFSSPQQTIQGTSDSWSMMSFGLKKDFKNKRGSLGIRVIEPFNKYKNMRTEIEGENFIQNSNRQIAMRSIGISFSYTFGKLNFKEKKVRTNIKNNDQIENNDSQGQ